ncbi:MAG: hypothetical protein QW707_03235 [Candidatus Bathyarchaeia archaeon]
MKSYNLTVCNPRGVLLREAVLPPCERVSELDGKVIGFYDNGKPGVDNFYKALGDLFIKKFPRVKIKIQKGPFQISEELARSFAKEIDTFVYAWGD